MKAAPQDAGHLDDEWNAQKTNVRQALRGQARRRQIATRGARYLQREELMGTYGKGMAALGAVVVAAVAWNCGGKAEPVGGADASTESGSSSGTSSSGGSSSSGSSSSGSSSSGSSSGGSSSSGSSSGGSGSGSGGNCPSCPQGNLCCNGVDCSVDALNDPNHCGACNVVCTAPDTFCNQGKCTPVPCSGPTCGTGTTCCGTACCNAGDICCDFIGPQDYIGCYTPTTAQPSCPPGCTQCVSDRNVKRDIVPVDPQEVLEGLVRVPVATWSYKKDDPSVRHMGPMAQDLHAQFGLGDTDKAYSQVDANGLAFAAIQALYERMQEQQARIDALERENAELRRHGGR